ncbi:MAG: S-layer homology domain-containing protein [Lachnospiraceae bacterium]|nr:S-layer homology domain-containing protein [Lachnospiraceae bacterium]
MSAKIYNGNIDREKLLTGISTFLTVCTAAAAFIWRWCGSPEASQKENFTDVSDGAYYAAAVSWGAENGIIDGYGGSKFGPGDTCTRGQAVTFLNRTYQMMQS